MFKLLCAGGIKEEGCDLQVLANFEELYWRNIELSNTFDSRHPLLG